MKDFMEELERLDEYQERKRLDAHRGGIYPSECFYAGYISALSFVIEKLKDMEHETL